MDAGIELLAEGGWTALTHRKLAARAGANPGLVHYYFKGTAGLHAAIAESVTTQLISPVVEELGAASSVREFAAIVAASLRVAAADPRSIRLMTTLLVGAVHDQAVGSVAVAEVQRARRSIADWLERQHPLWSSERAMAVATLVGAAIDGAFLHLALDPQLDANALAIAIEELAEGDNE